MQLCAPPLHQILAMPLQAKRLQQWFNESRAYVVYY